MFNTPSFWSLKEFDNWNDGSDAKEMTQSLLLAKRSKHALGAYEKLCDIVFVQGWLSPLAVPVTSAILSYIPKCARPAQIQSLELLGQIVAADIDDFTREVKVRCLQELREASWWILHGLEYDVPEAMWLYVDLIGALGDQYKDFRPKATIYLKMALKRNINDDDKILIGNTLIWDD